MEDKNKRYFSKKGRALIIASLFVLSFSALGLYYFIFVPDWSYFAQPISKDQTIINNDLENISATSSCLNCRQRYLDGVMVPMESAEAFPVALVLDNDVLARPQSGLSRASLVYEAPVEGGMTRYLAIYPADADISAIGPIRSARPYFVTWAEELKALFIHCGGSQEALNQLKSASLYDLNEFYQASYFWRDKSSSRPAPHNVFTSADTWRLYLKEKGLNRAEADAWLFKESGEQASSSPDINIYFSSNFRALWRYDSVANEYSRFFNGLAGTDEEQPITAKNIIIQQVKSRVLDKAGRLAIDTDGRGQAKICLDGFCQDGYWQKKTDKRTRYYYNNEEEIKLNPGITWIEVADNNTRID
jgi:hypothetical protein